MLVSSPGTSGEGEVEASLVPRHLREGREGGGGGAGGEARVSVSSYL